MTSMESKTAVVTGATDGIGKETALALAQRGARLVLPVRNEARGQAVVDAIRSRKPDAEVSLVQMELGKLESVRRAAARILEQCERIDVLVNNAGGVQKRRVVTEDGFELTLAVNHFGPHLLTRLLLDRLLDADGARVVYTSSVVHRRGEFELDDLVLARRWNSIYAYSVSKLMNLLSAMELHRLHGERGLAVSSMHPGAVRTGIWTKQTGWLGHLLSASGRFWMRTSAQGADTLIWLASATEAAEPRGQYFYERKRRRIPPFATQEYARMLWQESDRLVGWKDG